MLQLGDLVQVMEVFNFQRSYVTINPPMLSKCNRPSLAFMICILFETQVFEAAGSFQP